jgi:molybdopterin-guanine dinucleotide biosynthesis protein A
MTLSAVLLAGGESRRMGRDKATIIFEGEPLWQRQLRTLAQVGADQIFVSARNDPAWRPNDVVFVPDGDESHGPWSGLAATFAAISPTHLLVLAIDMPLMSAAYLNCLRELMQPSLGVVPVLDGRFEPLAAIYPREVHVDLANIADFSLQAFVRKIADAGKVAVVDVTEHDVPLFRNLNDPRDLAAAS